MSLRSLLLGVGILAITACASAGSGSGGAAPSAGRRDASVITRADLTDPAVRSLNVLEAIRALRPNFLVNRGTQTIVHDSTRNVTDPESGMVHASVDDSGVLPVEELRRIQASVVQEIRLLSVAAAMQRFGSTAKQGPVISVRTQ